jgi:hypothetical protein
MIMMIDYTYTQRSKMPRAFGTAQGEPSHHEKVVGFVDRESDNSDSLGWRDRNDVVLVGGH